MKKICPDCQQSNIVNPEHAPDVQGQALGIFINGYHHRSFDCQKRLSLREDFDHDGEGDIELLLVGDKMAL